MNCRDRQTLPVAGRAFRPVAPIFPRKAPQADGTALATPFSAAKHLAGFFA
jgi:hypothetical protein